MSLGNVTGIHIVLPRYFVSFSYIYNDIQPDDNDGHDNKEMTI